MTIRNYQPTDHDALATLYYHTRKEEFPWTAPNTLSLEDFDHATQGERILVAEAHDTVTGFLSVWEPDKFIHCLFVHKAHRHEGIAQALIQEAVSEYGLPLTLKCVAQNSNALRFYEQHGWKREREEMGDEGPYFVLTLAHNKRGM